MANTHFRQRQDYHRSFDLGIGEIIADVTTFYDDRVTETRVTILTRFSDKSYYGEGFALCRKGDHYDQAIGQRLSYVRAVSDALRDAELDLISQVKTEKQYRKAAKQQKASALSDDVPDDWSHYDGDQCEVA